LYNGPLHVFLVYQELKFATITSTITDPAGYNYYTPSRWSRGQMGV